MSSSPRRADPMQMTDPAAAEPHRNSAAEPFPYDTVAAGSVGRTSGYHGAIEGLAASSAAAADETAARETMIRMQARQEGEAAARRAFDEQLVRARSGLADALAQFTHDRATYFQKVEAEVVHLALSIARKILHREAQLDPLLLAGIVRVALEKIEGASEVRLRIHPQNAADWRRYLATHVGPSDLPEIVEDTAQEPDFCKLETSMGTAVIGLEVQLKEIEQGLMDLLASRPGAAQ
jgi:flagellar assembly protein FliH